MTLGQVDKILKEGMKLELSQESRERIVKCREYLDNKMKTQKEPIYGVTTGFGSLCNISISKEELSQLQKNLVMSHACGVGEEVPAEIVKIMLLKVVFAIATGFFVNFLLCAFKTNRRETASVVNLCEHSRCGCHKHKGVFYPALIHTLEVFFFILVVSGIVEAVIHFGGADVKSFFSCKIPFVTEMTAGLAGLIPNCAVSVGCATLYAQGAISEGALLASSFTGAGVGFLVLFRINRSIKENLMILFSVYFLGVVAGFLAGKII
jgi:hypothetical protein